MRYVILSALLAGALSAPALAKLPPLSDEAKAKAADAASKAAWSNKVGAYQLCRSMDRVAEKFRATRHAANAPSAVAVARSASTVGATASPTTPPCVDPGPYVAEAAPAKPIEAAGAHSPPEMAKGPPSTNATSSQIDGKK